MVQCKCGKPIDKIPDWLAGVTVEFICNNCPNRKHKNITQLDLGSPSIPKVEMSDENAHVDQTEEEPD